MLSAMGNPEEGSENFPGTDDRKTGLLGEVTVMRGKSLPGRCSSRETKQRCGQRRLTGQQGRVSHCPLQLHSPQRCQGLRGEEWGSAACQTRDCRVLQSCTVSRVCSKATLHTGFLLRYLLLLCFGSWPRAEPWYWTEAEFHQHCSELCVGT